ncbi:SprT family zinc-dependent metalloprotease [Aliiroseovarius sp. F20344]|uniref:M48 family metallopeptidase n=1 Tax=Aliiroseovarius sp. F20344 TaxID=2926414 RepID=UPI001FF5C251|nr:SprT family zinc-dependent metalloprotease [Aliiroseovarius sp. F20344]MCK0142741.1 M48 family metallopeptidase [Aliiroseovarius sp. F20344]
MFFNKSRQRLTENSTLKLGNPDPVTIELRVSNRARRLSLRVSRLDGRVTLTAPVGSNQDEVMRFAQERLEWIRGHLAQTAPSEVPQIGSSLPFRGVELSLVRGQARVVEVYPGRLLLPPQSPKHDVIRLEAFLKENARAALVAASDHYAEMVGRPYGRITLRDTRSRWGSCSSRGNLSYSWRLVMAPPEVLNYVAAHEVSHLVHMDHSPAFWAQVGAIFPNYETPRKWLKDHGTALHRFRFRD